MAEYIERLGGYEQESEPLTIEELLQMDGEPVWIEMRCAGFNYANQNRKEWALIHRVDDGFFLQFYGDMLYGPDEWYGADGDEAIWLAYRHKVTEEVDHGEM